jgi:hypothetical protein
MRRKGAIEEQFSRSVFWAVVADEKDMKAPLITLGLRGRQPNYRGEWTLNAFEIHPGLCKGMISSATPIPRLPKPCFIRSVIVLFFALLSEPRPPWQEPLCTLRTATSFPPKPATLSTGRYFRFSMSFPYRIISSQRYAVYL